MKEEKNILELEKSGNKMHKKKRKNKGLYIPKNMSSQHESYLQAMAEELEEAKLRVKLYREVIIQASEALGIDILTKIGDHRSGP
jgi:predicted RNA-binding protein with PUA domain